MGHYKILEVSSHRKQWSNSIPSKLLDIQFLRPSHVYLVSESWGQVPMPPQGPQVNLELSRSDHQGQFFLILVGNF